MARVPTIVSRGIRGDCNEDCLFSRRRQRTGPAAYAAQAPSTGTRKHCFRDFQWFLFEAKDAVYFTAFSKLAHSTRIRLGNIVAEMVALAPQLTHGFVGARPGQPFPKHLLDAITDVQIGRQL